VAASAWQRGRSHSGSLATFVPVGTDATAAYTLEVTIR
jgi:hypothetical protein